MPQAPAVERFDIPGVGPLARAVAPFDAALDALEAAGAVAPVPCAVLAEARRAAGPGSPPCAPGGFVREAVVYARGEAPLLVRESPLLGTGIRERAMARHAAGEEVYLGEQLAGGLHDELRAQAERDRSLPVERRRVHELEHRAVCRIAIGDLAAQDCVRWLLGGAGPAERYAAFLREQGREDVPLWLVDWLTPEQERLPYVRQLYFGGIGTGSSINGGRLLGHDDGSMGPVWGRFDGA